MDSNSRIYVAGRDTLAGRALAKRLAERGFTQVIQEADPDFADRRAVSAFFERLRPEFVFLTAGKVSGIAGNQQWPADLMIDNLRAVSNVVPAAWDMMQLNVHLCATIPHAMMIEHISWIRDIFRFPVQLDAGSLVVPDEPGIGTEIKADAMEKYAVA